MDNNNLDHINIPEDNNIAYSEKNITKTSTLSKILYWVLGLLILILLVGSGYWYYKKYFFVSSILNKLANKYKNLSYFAFDLNVYLKTKSLQNKQLNNSQTSKNNNSRKKFVTLNGELDYSQKDNPKFLFKFVMNGKLNTQFMEIRFFKDKFFIRQSQIPLSSIPWFLDGKWVKSSYNKEFKPDVYFSKEYLLNNNIWSLFQKNNPLNIRYLGISKNIDDNNKGKYYHFVFNVDKNKLIILLNQLYKNSDFRKILLEEEFYKSLKDLINSLNVLSGDFYIGKADLLIHKVTLNTKMKSLFNDAVLYYDIELLLKYNKISEISKPKDAKTIDEWMKERQFLTDSLLKKDSDHDGLNDVEELRIFNTDPNNPDTDGDGYLDGEEVSKGYNPNGPGKLKDF